MILVLGQTSSPMTFYLSHNSTLCWKIWRQKLMLNHLQPYINLLDIDILCDLPGEKHNSAFKRNPNVFNPLEIGLLTFPCYPSNSDPAYKHFLCISYTKFLYMHFSIYYEQEIKVYFSVLMVWNEHVFQTGKSGANQCIGSFVCF